MNFDWLNQFFDGTLFDKLDNVVNSTEGSLVNFLTAFAPWIAPLAPAYMTFQHMTEYLHFPFLLALVLAVLVEILGFGTVSTGLDFWFYNRREKANVKKAPVWLVVGVFGFYLVLILASNVAIDISNSFLDEWWQKVAVIVVRALLTLQTIPGALIVAVRTGHRELLREIKKEKAEKLSESFQKVSKTSEGNLPKDWRKLLPTLTLEELIGLANLSKEKIAPIAENHGVDYKTVENWVEYAQRELDKRGLNKDGTPKI